MHDALRLQKRCELLFLNDCIRRCDVCVSLPV